MSKKIRNLFLLMSILLFGCNEQLKASPEEYLVRYAKLQGGEWIEEIKTLQGIELDVKKIKELPSDSLNLIKRLSFKGPIGKIPDLGFLINLEYLHLPRRGVTDISNLNGLSINTLILSENPFTDLSPLVGCANLKNLELSFSKVSKFDPLSKCISLQSLGLSGNNIGELPDFSLLIDLREIYLIESELKTLNNIETIPNHFDLNIMECENLEDIDALRFSNVDTLFIDELTYNRFNSWFDAHLEEIKTKNPEFNIRFDMFE
ncbi:MAG: hypothetical protein PQJ46_00645 [Spirochaetales bacterium]|nr:hypothetical protein [Spirochaetales bacterium]